jgi:hypothetical protein
MGDTSPDELKPAFPSMDQKSILIVQIPVLRREICGASTGVVWSNDPVLVQYICQTNDFTGFGKNF